MNNLNAYNENEFKERFSSTPLYQQLIKEYQLLIWSYATPFNHTVRKMYGLSSFSVAPFYYLEKLTEKNPKEIYDLGCGWNIFKKYIPNIIGVGPSDDPMSDPDHVDIFGKVDTLYVQEHCDFFESIFSINALHYIPLDKLRYLLYDFLSMIKPGGRGFLTLNIARLKERASEKFLIDTFGTKTPSIDALEEYVRKTISTLKCNFLIVDIDFSQVDNFLDGNIRLVIEKKEI
jgi:hypothetical protein